MAHQKRIGGFRIFGQTVGDYYGVIAFYCFVHNSFCKVDGEEHRIHLPAERVEWGFKKYFSKSAQDSIACCNKQQLASSIVPTLVSQLLGIPAW